MKVVKSFVGRKQREGGGFVVRRGIGGRELDYLDPILMLDHLGPTVYAPGEAIGAPAHPHRGFSTITYMLSGSFVHKDSLGNTGKLSKGWVQWMDAAKGIVHSEMPGPELMRDGGRLHGFQIWLNLPAAEKMSSCRYQDVPPEEIPVVKLGSTASVKVIAGKTLGIDGAVVTKTPSVFYDVMFAEADKELTVLDTLDPEYNLLAYVYHGTVSIHGKDYVEGSTIIFGKDGTTAPPEGFSLRAMAKAAAEPDEDGFLARFLLIGGKPIKEPIARYGPFVMNTQDEIEQAFIDYQSGRFEGKPIPGQAEELAQTRRARLAQQQSGLWREEL